MSEEKRVASGGEDWLEELEATIRQAGETIETLRREKADLGDRVQELEAKLGQVEDGEEGGGDRAATAWREERKAIRERVRKLTERLEGLLEE